MFGLGFTFTPLSEIANAPLVSPRFGGNSRVERARSCSGPALSNMRSCMPAMGCRRVRLAKRSVVIPRIRDMTDWIDPNGWPRDSYAGPGGGLYTGPGGGLYTGPGGGAYTGPGGGAYTGPGGGAYTGPGGGLYTGPGGGCFSGPGGGLYSGPGGGIYTGPGGELYTGPGGGAYSGPPASPQRRNWPPISILIAHLRSIECPAEANLIARIYGLD